MTEALQRPMLASNGEMVSALLRKSPVSAMRAQFVELDEI